MQILKYIRTNRQLRRLLVERDRYWREKERWYRNKIQDLKTQRPTQPVELSHTLYVGLETHGSPTADYHRPGRQETGRK